MTDQPLPHLPERFALVDLRTMLQPRPPMQWAVRGLIPATGLTVFFGNSGVKKTWSVLHLAACLSLGRDWLDMPTAQGNVLILDEESGVERLARRLTTIFGGLGLDAYSETLPSITATCSNGIDLAKVTKSQNDAATIYQKIIDTGAKYVVIDSLSRIMTGDENSVQDTQPVMSALARLSQLAGVAVILIHHANKAGGYRGSTTIRATVDAFIKVESAEDSPVVSFDAEKIRDGETKKFAGMAAWDAVLDTFSLTATDSVAAQHKAADAQVIEVLHKHGQATRREIGEFLNLTDSIIGKSLARLKDTGQIKRVNQQSAGRGVEAVFKLADRPSAGVAG